MLNIEVHSENQSLHGPQMSVGVNTKYKTAALIIEHKGEADTTLSVKLDEEMIHSLITALDFAKQQITNHQITLS